MRQLIVPGFPQERKQKLDQQDEERTAQRRAKRQKHKVQLHVLALHLLCNDYSGAVHPMVHASGSAAAGGCLSGWIMTSLDCA